MKHFFQKLDNIDSILQNGASRENAECLVALMTDPVSSFYVFDKFDASWLEPLESIGYFRQLSSGIGGSKDEPTAFLPASAYLKKIAADAGANGDLAQTLQRVLFSRFCEPVKVCKGLRRSSAEIVPRSVALQGAVGEMPPYPHADRWASFSSLPVSASGGLPAPR